jgi:lipoprotein-anchoring transpeptidase ErfK/SrfK
MNKNMIPLEQIVAEAKHAISTGDKATAQALAEQAYRMNPKSVDALLLKAGTSDPQSAIQYLNAALVIDPGNAFAREAMTYTAAQVRSNASAAWKPEETSEVRINPVPILKPQRQTSFALPLAIAFCALLVVGLVKFGVIKVNAGDKLFGVIPLAGQSQTNGKAAADAYDPTQAFGTASAYLTVTVQPKAATGGQAVHVMADIKATQPIPTVKIFVPLVGSNGQAGSANQATAQAQATAVPGQVALTPTPTATKAASPALPIIQITPIAPGSTGKITSTIVTAESGEGSLEPAPADETAIPVEIPMIPIIEVPAEVAAQYAFTEAQPVVSYGEKWIDIDLTNQMLYAYEGDTLLNSFLVSTGLPGTPTVTGTYSIYVKYLYAHMRGDDYDLPDVPYTMYFFESYGIHGTYWHHNFGVPMSHGCVNMETSQAGWIFEWAPVGTIVNVHY